MMRAVTSHASSQAFSIIAPPLIQIGIPRNLRMWVPWVRTQHHGQKTRTTTKNLTLLLGITDTSRTKTRTDRQKT